ncbi:hypothetical protein DTO013E5_3668 [Penicillium roqueforti]|uniref:Genomic scaffold, ProqFM164S02 n=1 Tax=Penicillium roqueforti (strain FM164) TaxID=1365484 RepID=W6Q6X8_PENRF|nr:uncharacterized protein LCP9604111_375 [Penicillium roqueforti]CDM32110.1 unnamed protein product [Penicillium roqueforti FM164]KAF9252849.1 hypothetical protein LCP9604111_375 [Penicillium roqueforti]KAI1830648.1 hypothetical protein CBS147337_8496 [Penicillium roqueforti]KAI2676053.1 hypothetical protein CBS147355_6234 [Penicillium roqueforti]KAI2679260.1 hypothetical protein LCP963914a_7359 [Penicillium roqueforti]
MSDSFISSTYYYSSTTNGTDGRTTTGHRYSTTSYTEPDGSTVVRTAQQDLGQPAVVEERRYDNTGQEQLALPEPGGSSAGGIRRITELEDDVSDSKDTPTPDSAPNVMADIRGAAAQLLDGDGEDDSFSLVSSPLGSRVYDPVTGNYNDSEYDIGGVTRRHREGRRFGRDVNFASDGFSSAAREDRPYENPSTGTRLQRGSDVDVRDVL